MLSLYELFVLSNKYLQAKALNSFHGDEGE